MNYKEYFKKEAQNLIFIELEKPLILSINNTTITIPEGDYPVHSQALLSISQNKSTLTAQNIIDGMITILGTDPDFPHNAHYISILKKVPNIESYIIHQIEQSRTNNLKKAIIYTTALINLSSKKEFQMNRIYLLMDYYQKTNLPFLQDEILEGLKNLLNNYPDYEPANFYIAEYYLDKDLDLAKHHLRKCLNHKAFKQEAEEYLQKIDSIENYDRAVDLLKEGYPKEALKILIPYIESNPKNLDAIYYTAVAYREIGNHQKALLYLQDLLNILETPEVDNEIGLNLAFLGYFEDAIEYFKKALKFKPKDTSIITNIAVCYLNLNKIEEAKKELEYAIKINPKDEIAKEWLAKIMV